MEVYHFAIPNHSGELLIVVVKITEGELSMKCIARVDESRSGVALALHSNGRIMQLPHCKLSEVEEELVIDRLREVYTSTT
jgi:hypothetical protein